MERKGKKHMREHAVVSPRFWTGDTGRFLRNYPDAQRLALYLMTCPNSTMTGLYYLPLPTICHELPISREGALEGLARASEGGFCRYDEPSETVFVLEMAKFQIGESMKETDNKIDMVEKQLRIYRKHVFFKDFMKRYAEVFHLSEQRIMEDPYKPLQRGSPKGKGKEKEKGGGFSSSKTNQEEVEERIRKKRGEQ